MSEERQIKNPQSIEIQFQNHPPQRRIIKTWTKEDDENLLKIYKQYPKKWKKIAQMMINRNQNQCLHRFRRINSQNNDKKMWSNQEDMKVTKLYQQYGNNWKMIALNLKTKTGKQIRERFINKLDRQIRNQQFSRIEDLKIIRLFAKYGSRWSIISRHLPGRPQNKIKNRFYSYIKKHYNIFIKQQETDLVIDSVSQKNKQQEKLPYNYSNILINNSNLQQIQFLAKNKQNIMYEKQSKIPQKQMKLQNSMKLSPDKRDNQLQLLQINELNEILNYRQLNSNEEILYFEQI